MMRPYTVYDDTNYNYYEPNQFLHSIIHTLCEKYQPAYNTIFINDKLIAFMKNPHNIYANPHHIFRAPIEGRDLSKTKFYEMSKFLVNVDNLDLIDLPCSKLYTIVSHNFAYNSFRDFEHIIVANNYTNLSDSILGYLIGGSGNYNSILMPNFFDEDKYFSPLSNYYDDLLNIYISIFDIIKSNFPKLFLDETSFIAQIIEQKDKIYDNLINNLRHSFNRKLGTQFREGFELQKIAKEYGFTFSHSSYTFTCRDDIIPKLIKKAGQGEVKIPEDSNPFVIKGLKIRVNEYLEVIGVKCNSRESRSPHVNGSGKVCIGDLENKPLIEIIKNIKETLSIINLDSAFGGEYTDYANEIFDNGITTKVIFNTEPEKVFTT